MITKAGLEEVLEANKAEIKEAESWYKFAAGRAEDAKKKLDAFKRTVEIIEQQLKEFRE